MKNQNLFLSLVFCSCLAFENQIASAQTEQNLDTFIEQQAINHRIPNSVVVWVKDGEVLFQKITQDTSIDGTEAIDPSRSLFRIASISKPFTALAALRFERNGLLDFDADINSYFDEPLIKYRFGKPITIRHLLTHTAGFDDFYINKSVRSKDELKPLAYNIKTLMPRQITALGEVSTYSNYGVALLGHILEKVSNDDFSNLMEKSVFVPLNMIRTTFDLNENEYPNLVKSWYSAYGNMQIAPFDYVKDVPAGQMLTTVNDIVSFLKLITATDTLPNQKGDMQELFRKSISKQFTHHPKLQGAWASLWNLTEYSGHYVVMHGGGYIGVACQLFYFPEHNQAFFIFSNLMNFGFISSVTNELISNFLPTIDQQTEASSIIAIEIEDNFKLSDFSGHYRNTRYSRNSMLKMVSLFGLFGAGEMRITHDGEYLLMPDHTGKPRRLVRTDTLLFSSIDDDYHIAFRKQDNKITHVFTSGTSALEKISFFESQRLNQIFFFFIVTLFALLLIIGLGKLIVGLIKKSHLRFNFVFLLIIIVSLAYVLQFVFLFLGGASLEPYEFEIGFAYGVPKLFYVANIMPIIAVLLTVALVFFIYKTKLSKKLLAYSIVFTLLSVLYFVFLNYWNLVGWKF